jgi:exodeoxyribonuclease VII large subunit
MKTVTVSELTFAIKSLLEPAFRAVCVQGEISNFKLQTSGHLYFSLKDPNSQISCALFKGNASKLTRLPKEGDQVIAIGELSLYAPRGQYQLIVRELQFHGMGELLLKFEQLKETLRARGWFDRQKKPLPKLPKRIGVITSPTGAVIQDILHILTRRFAGFHVILNPVKVQGEGAANEIAQAIYDFNKYDLADVLIVGRGGGSIEDLWAFNEEIVAKALFESKIPTISAVGHETDVTIADWVADVRAPTPSAAAEIVIAEKANLIKFLLQASQLSAHRVQDQIRQSRYHLTALQKHPLLSSPYNLLSQPIQKLDDIQTDLQMSLRMKLDAFRTRLHANFKRLETLSPASQTAQFKQRLSTYPARLKAATETTLRQKKEQLRALTEHLSSLNPKNVLKKGYSILFSEKDHSIILSAKEIQTGEKLTALLPDGQLFATVDKVDSNDTRNSLF